jgi:hypothetical protein
MKLLFGRPSHRSGPSISGDSQESIERAGVVAEGSTSEPADQLSVGPLIEEEVEAGDYEQDAQQDLQEDESEPEIGSSSTTTVSEELPHARNWFLIRTSKGTLRACRCNAGTPSVVAGPFESKEAANRAKLRFTESVVQSRNA